MREKRRYMRERSSVLLSRSSASQPEFSFSSSTCTGRGATVKARGHWQRDWKGVAKARFRSSRAGYILGRLQQLLVAHLPAGSGDEHMQTREKMA